MSIQVILQEVALERIRQDGKWGGPGHDDKHSPNDWYEILTDYCGWARRMLCMGSPLKARRRFIQIAAIAIAIVERIDRLSEERQS